MKLKRNLGWLVLMLLAFTVSTVSVASAAPALIDLSTLTNLEDDQDDSSAVEAAIGAAREGGGILIPHGRAIISRSVTIPYDRFTLLGSGPSVSSLILTKSATLGMKAKKASFALRNLGLVADSGNTEKLLDLATEQPGELTLRQLSISTKGGRWQTAIHCAGFDTVTLDAIEIAGDIGSTNGIRFARNGKSLLLTNLKMEALANGLFFDDPFAYTQMMRVEMQKVTDGIVFAPSAKSTKLQLGESVFDDCLCAVTLKSPARMTLLNCRFMGSPERHNPAPDVRLENAAISGTLTGNDFYQGVYCAAVDHLGISGNLFRDGFQSSDQVANAHVVIGQKALVQLEGNRFVNELKPNILNLQTKGAVLYGSEIDLSK